MISLLVLQYRLSKLIERMPLEGEKHSLSYLKPDREFRKAFGNITRLVLRTGNVLK